MNKLLFSARFWKICILFPATVFLVYAECTFIWMIVNYWNSDRLFALVGVYFFEVTGMLLAVCVRSCVRCFQKYPTEYIPLPDKKWRRLFIGTVLLETPINELCVRCLDQKDTIMIGYWEYITLMEENLEGLLKTIKEHSA